MSSQVVDTETTEEVHVDNYGGLEARYIKEITINKMVNQTTEKNTLIITAGEWMYNIDLDKETGKKMKNLKTEFLGDIDKGDMEKFAKQLTGSMKADIKKLEDMEIAGVLCEGNETSTNIMGMKTSATTYLYKNYVFLNKSNSMGTEIEDRVVEFLENIKVDRRKFEVPKNIKLETLTNPFGN